jgi:hypothetical protein
MMKNKVQIMGAGLIALLLALAGCANPLDERPDASPKAVSGGKIVVTLGGLDARTLGPIADDVAGLHYRLVLQNYDKIIEEDIEDFSQPVERSVEPGYWMVGVLAYTEGNKTAWGCVFVEDVRDGETRAAPITLLPATDQDAAGIFDYDIAFPDPTHDFDYTITYLGLKPEQYGNSSEEGCILINLRDFDKKAAKLELPAGKYNLDILLESTRQVNGKPLQVVVKEIVYLYPGLTTQAHYKFTEAHFAAEVYLKGTAYVNSFTPRSYTPTEVQLKLHDSGWYDETNIQRAAIANGAWELTVPSEKIGGAYNASTVQLRFVATSDTDATQKLTSAWQDYWLNTIQGHTGIVLSTSVYPIAKNSPNPYFVGIEGVSGIAHNSDAVPYLPVALKITALSNYGLIGNSVYASSNWGANYLSPEPDGTFIFIMPPSAVTVSADFFHLKGTASIPGENLLNYQPVTVEAYAEKWDEKTEGYIREQIGSAANIAPNGAWEIAIPDGYIYTGSGDIYFKVFSEATGQPDQDYTTPYSVDSLTGTETATLFVPLFEVSNFRQTEATVDSVTIAWDDAAWATGYNIYRDGTKIATHPLPAGATSYSDTELPWGQYQYAIAGIYDDPATEEPPTEGNRSYLTATTALAAPANVKAETTDTPFQVYVSWNPVVHADSYEVYRDGNMVASTSYSYYYDSEYKTLGEKYAYKVVAKNWTYGVTSADSATAEVSFPITANLTVNNPWYDSISVLGEIDYYRFSVPDYGYYGCYFDQYDGYMYGYVYRNGSLYTTFVGNTSYEYYYPGEEIILAVRANNYGNTGYYGIGVNYSW